jgi:hypothetical protein
MKANKAAMAVPRLFMIESSVVGVLATILGWNCMGNVVAVLACVR